MKLLREIVKFNHRFRLYLLVVFCLGLGIDLFLLSKMNDWLAMGLILLWILALYNFRFGPKLNYSLAAILLSAAFSLQLFRKDVFVEKSTSWAMVFLLVGLVQSLVLRNEKRE